ncbi:MAG: tRNA (N(6)-L-threonylcarbamoyladenosine(37)-C(2))-methylthiotransferase MtaB [Ruminococcus sp.]
MTFSIFSFGCKVNQYESEFISELMIQEGFTLSASDKECDIYIVNSCSVTAVSDSKCRRFLHRLRRNNPKSIILLCGCMSQAFPRKYSNFTDCDIVTGNTSRAKIPEYIKAFIKNGQPIIAVDEHNRKSEEFEEVKVTTFSERTRAFVKIEDGCDRFCTYCIIPYARGRVRSKPLQSLITEVEALAENGYCEIVLVGINLSKYGTDLSLTLADAVEAVASVQGVRRVRLGSLEPELLTEDIIKRLAECTKLCPQFHLSLQSGCNATLKRMNRHYTSAEYMEIVSRLRKAFDNPSVTTDVMVGFPGETEEEFNESLEFVKSVGFAKVHVFPFSRREGTVADKLDNQLTKSVKDSRAKIMTDATNLDRAEFIKSQISLLTEVLFEHKNETGMYEGYSLNYTPVYVSSDEDISAKCLNVKITSASDDYCIGELI